MDQNIAKDPFTEEAAHAQAGWPAYLGGDRIAWNKDEYLAIVAKVAAEREAAEQAKVAAEPRKK